MKRYRKPYRIKKKKPIFKNRFFWLGIMALAAAASLSYFLLFSEFFQIKNVIITGEKKVSREAIESFVPRKNIFFIDAGKIEKDILNDFPLIAGVEIHRIFPNSLNILVFERSPSVFWCEEEKCFSADGQGVIFEEAPPEIDLIKIYGEKEIFGKEIIAQILEIRGKLKEALAISAVRAFIASPERLNIETSEGWEIYFNSKGDLNWQMQELGLVLEKQISPEKRKNLEYVDLRFSRVYYK